MGLDELCQECKEQKLKQMHGDIYAVDPWDHCHHKKELKEKCWCEDEYIKLISKTPLSADVCGFLVNINFCPECGHKMEG